MDWIAALLSLIIVIAPGTLLSLAVLKGESLSRFEKFFLSIAFGVIIVPLLLFLEYFFLGIDFSAGIVLANSFLVFAVSLAALYFQKQFPSLGGLNATVVWKALKDNWVYALLLLFILTGFYVRLVPAHSAEFFEFDPYYYDKLTQELVQNGRIEMYSSDAYYPFEAFRHYAPLAQYAQGAWYSLYELFAGLGAYSQDSLILVSQLYPPLVGALLSFLAFLIIKDEFGELVALAPAAFFAFTPQLVKKLAAGVNEQQPWGFFTAMLIFAVLVLLVNRKSWRLAALGAVACAAAALGSQQYVWPFMILASYLTLQAVMDFLSGSLDLDLVKKNALVVAGAWFGSFVVDAYQAGHMGAGVGFLHYLMAIGLGLTVALYYAREFFLKGRDSFKARLGVLAAVGVLCIPLFFFVTDFGWTAVRVVESQLTFAEAHVPLAKTIQEEGATSEALWASSYGVLNPPALLLSAALLAAASAVIDLAVRKRKREALAFGAVSFALLALQSQSAAVLGFLGSSLGFDWLASGASFLAANPVFVYLAVALAASIISYYFASGSRRSALLLVLVFFPIAFIGLNKLKYMVHLAFALCLATGYILGEASRLLVNANDWLKVTSDKAFVKNAALGFVILLSVVGVAAQANTVPATMAQLEATRIPLDWTSTYDWMAESIPDGSRVMSWWDYGHWTTFFGNTNTVLDPVNEKGLLDQGVAYGFVEATPEEFYNIMDYHGATHVLVDWELVGKWGALAYLSGTCDSELSQFCSVEPAISDWKQGPGKSQYEAEHYFEYLNLVGTCPSSGLVELPAYQSSFGAVYCLTQDSFLLLGRNGIEASYQRPIYGAVPGATVEGNASYLTSSFYYRDQLINVNPDLSVYGLESDLVDSNFVKLFFFEELPGFKLVYRSPNNLVKVFEYEGRP